MPKVSIIVPIYNKAQYLKVVFTALINQTFTDWEIIAINDGSTDNSFDIMQNFAKRDDRIKVYTQPNQGVSVTRNNGIKKATGEWIWFVDSDDIPSETFLGEAFEADYDNADVIVANFQKKKAVGEAEHVCIDEAGTYQKSDLPDLFMKYQYENGYWGYLWNKLIRTDLIISNNICFRPGLTLAEDLDFMIKIYQKAKIILLLPKFAIQYTVEAENSSADKMVDYRAQLNIQLSVYKWIVETYKKAIYEDPLKKHISIYAACIVFYAFENGEDYMTDAKKLSEDKFIFGLLSADVSDSAMRTIVECLCKKSWLKLRLYLNLRKLLRKVYRLFQGVKR